MRNANTHIPGIIAGKLTLCAFVDGVADASKLRLSWCMTLHQLNVSCGCTCRNHQCLGLTLSISDADTPRGGLHEYGGSK